MIPTNENLDQWLFDSLEGNLSPEQQDLLQQFFTQHPELELEQEAWSRATFSAQPITFEPKSTLYRKKKLGYKSLAAAALVLLFGTIFFFNSSTQTKSQQTNVAAAKHFKSTSKNTRQTSSTSFQSALTPAASFISNSLHTPTFSLFSSGIDGASTALPYLAPTKISGYRTDLRFESLAGIASDIKAIKKPQFPALQHISRFAQKELGLSNNQSYDLLLPGKSNIDANLSSVGTLSQIRFQSISLARTGTDLAQALVGQQISLDTYARKLRSGIGFQGSHQQYAGGAVSDYEIGLIAAPKIALNRQIILEPAARLRMGARYANASKLEQLSFIEFENADLREVQIDTLQSIGRRLFYKDLDLSLAVQTPFFFASAQIDNAFSHFDYAMGNEQNPSNSRAPRQFTIAIGTQYASRNEKMRLSPYFLYTNNNLQAQYFIGTQINVANWQFGLCWSNNQQYQASVGYFGKHTALLVQSTQHQLLSLNTPSYLHQLTFRVYSQPSRKARRYISL
jgi:hypothetical protein